MNELLAFCIAYAIILASILIKYVIVRTMRMLVKKRTPPWELFAAFEKAYGLAICFLIFPLVYIYKLITTK